MEESRDTDEQAGESAVESILGSRPILRADADPVLAMRLARQREKEQTGESAVENTGSRSDLRADVDPVLAARLARQQEKERTGESAIIDAQLASKADKAAYDPKLAARLAQQQHKLESGDASAVAHVGSRGESKAEMDAKLAERMRRQQEKRLAPVDPVLAARMEQQQRKVLTGESAVDNVGGARSYEAQLDPKLAARLAKQQHKVDTGEKGFVTPRSSNKGGGDDALGAMLAHKFEKRQQAASASNAQQADLHGLGADGQAPFAFSPVKGRRRAAGGDSPLGGRGRGGCACVIA